MGKQTWGAAAVTPGTGSVSDGRGGGSGLGGTAVDRAEGAATHCLSAAGGAGEQGISCWPHPGGCSPLTQGKRVLAWGGIQPPSHGDGPWGS